MYEKFNVTRGSYNTGVAVMNIYNNCLQQNGELSQKKQFKQFMMSKQANIQERVFEYHSSIHFQHYNTKYGQTRVFDKF